MLLETMVQELRVVEALPSWIHDACGWPSAKREERDLKTNWEANLDQSWSTS